MDNQQPSNKNWVDVKVNNKYEVNEEGLVRNKETGKILKPRLNPGGYAYVNFIIDGKRKNFAVHRIVAEAFIPNPNDYQEVNHKDYNRSNNNVSNLEWVNSSQNKKHAYIKEENRIARGKEVAKYDLNNNLIKIYDTISMAAKDNNCCVGAISNCCLGRSKTSMGYRWKFVEGSTTKYKRNPSLSARDSLKKDEDIV